MAYAVIQDISASGSGHEVDVTGYEQVEVQMLGVTADSSGTVDMQFSPDGGTTWRTTSGDYKEAGHSASSEGLFDRAQIFLMQGTGTGPHWGSCRVNHLHLAKEKSAIGVYGQGGGATTRAYVFTLQEVINRLRIQPSAGLFNGGRILVLGRLV